VNLQGTGAVTLSDSSSNSILSNGKAASLTNAVTISGAGSIGNGDTTLILINKGTIDANGTNPLIVNTGANTILSPGTPEATNGGSLVLDSRVASSDTGAATIDGGTIEFKGISNISATFAASDFGATVKVIRTLSDLQNMQNNLAAHYILDNNIDASCFLFTPVSRSSLRLGLWLSVCSLANAGERLQPPEPPAQAPPPGRSIPPTVFAPPPLIRQACAQYLLSTIS
jgi:hypothetical protein